MMRRIAAIVLSDLACEIARRQEAGLIARRRCPERRRQAGAATSPRNNSLDEPPDRAVRAAEPRPFAVIVDEEEGTADEAVDKTATLHAVNRLAWQYGARPGHRASQAAAHVGGLEIVRISKSSVRAALGALAERCLSLGTNAALALSIEKGRLLLRDEALAAGLRYPLGAGAGPEDTVWLDVTGCAGLVGGEEALALELEEQARELGHRARVAIADGPRIAQALARWSPRSPLIAPPSQNSEALHTLPAAALPLAPELITWLGKLGILRIEDLARLDRARLSHRLGAAARDLLELIAGRDDVPLVAFSPSRRIVEHTSFDHEIDSTEPLLFVLRGLTARAMARLTARGEACSRAGIRLGFDRSVVALENENRAAQEGNPLELEEELVLDLPVPLSRESELMGALTAQLERAVLHAPVVSLALVLDELTPEEHHQLEITGRTSVDPSALPTLLAELEAQLGSDRVGVLEVVDNHRPEARTRLVPIDEALLRDRSPASSMSASSSEAEIIPTRILPEPVLLPVPDRQSLPRAMVVIDRQPFIIEQLRHTARIDRIEWWSSAPVSRDYARAWLVSAGESGASTRSEAWLFTDRETGQTFLHGWFE